MPETLNPPAPLLLTLDFTKNPQEFRSIAACQWLAETLGPEYKETSENPAWKALDILAIKLVGIACILYIKPALEYWSPSLALGVTFAAGGVISNLGPNVWSGYGITQDLRPSSVTEQGIFNHNVSLVRKALFKIMRSGGGLSAALPFAQVGYETMDQSAGYFWPAIAFILVGDWLLKWFGLEDIAANMGGPASQVKWTPEEQKQINIIKARLLEIQSQARQKLLSMKKTERETALPTHYNNQPLSNKLVTDIFNLIKTQKKREIDDVFALFYENGYSTQQGEYFNGTDLCNVIAKLGLKDSFRLLNKRLNQIQKGGEPSELNAIISKDSDIKDKEKERLLQKSEEGNTLTLEEMRIVDFLMLTKKSIAQGTQPLDKLNRYPGVRLFQQLLQLIEVEIGLQAYKEALHVGGKLNKDYQGPLPKSKIRRFVEYGGGLSALAGLAGYDWKAKTASFGLAGDMLPSQLPPEAAGWVAYLAVGTYWGIGSAISGISWVSLGWLVGKAGVQVTGLLIDLAIAKKEGRFNETLQQTLPVKLYPKMTFSSLGVALIAGSLSWATNALVNDEVFSFDSTGYLRGVMRWLAIIIAVEFNSFAFMVGIIAPTIVAVARKFSTNPETKDLAQCITQFDSFCKKFQNMPPENALLILEQINDQDLMEAIRGNLSQEDLDLLISKAKTAPPLSFKATQGFSAHWQSPTPQNLKKEEETISLSSDIPPQTMETSS